MSREISSNLHAKKVKVATDAQMFISVRKVYRRLGGVNGKEEKVEQTSVVVLGEGDKLAPLTVKFLSRFRVLRNFYGEETETWDEKKQERKMQISMPSIIDLSKMPEAKKEAARVWLPFLSKWKVAGSQEKFEEAPLSQESLLHFMYEFDFEFPTRGNDPDEYDEILSTFYLDGWKGLQGDRHDEFKYYLDAIATTQRYESLPSFRKLMSYFRRTPWKLAEYLLQAFQITNVDPSLLDRRWRVEAILLDWKASILSEHENPQVQQMAEALINEQFFWLSPVSMVHAGDVKLVVLDHPRREFFALSEERHGRRVSDVARGPRLDRTDEWLRMLARPPQGPARRLHTESLAKQILEPVDPESLWQLTAEQLKLAEDDDAWLTRLNEHVATGMEDRGLDPEEFEVIRFSEFEGFKYQESAYITGRLDRKAEMLFQLLNEFTMPTYRAPTYVPAEIGKVFHTYSLWSIRPRESNFLHFIGETKALSVGDARRRFLDAGNINLDPLGRHYMIVLHEVQLFPLDATQNLKPPVPHELDIRECLTTLPLDLIDKMFQYSFS